MTARSHPNLGRMWRGAHARCCHDGCRGDELIAPSRAGGPGDLALEHDASQVLLGDTHALLWELTDDAQLSATARQWLGDEGNQVLVSAVSAWKIATQQRFGMLQGIAPVARWYSDLVAADGFLHLPVTHAHALRAGAGAVAYRDIFDRMLAAQAELASLPLITCDAALAAFACKTVW